MSKKGIREFNLDQNPSIYSVFLIYCAGLTIGFAELAALLIDASIDQHLHGFFAAWLDLFDHSLEALPDSFDLG
jgi:hypothetical protein